MEDNFTQINREVQVFLTASEQLYRTLATGAALNVHEAETIRCCLEELGAKEIEASRARKHSTHRRFSPKSG